MAKKIRASLIKRKTKETDISGKLAIDGRGKADVKTGIGFLDHMLTLFAFHGLFDLTLKVKGDLKVDMADLAVMADQWLLEILVKED